MPRPRLTRRGDLLTAYDSDGREIFAAVDEVSIIELQDSLVKAERMVGALNAIIARRRQDREDAVDAIAEVLSKTADLRAEHATKAAERLLDDSRFRWAPSNGEDND